MKTFLVLNKFSQLTELKTPLFLSSGNCHVVPYMVAHVLRQHVVICLNYEIVNSHDSDNQRRVLLV